MKVLVIIPYLGNLKPDIVQSLNSLLNNENIFVLFVSDNDLDLQHNRVKHVKLTRDTMEMIIRSKLKVNTKLSIPYKLCDFKPYLWKIFEDYYSSNEYDYVGYCDLDVVYGDLSGYLNCSDANVIGSLGHFCILDRSSQERLSYELVKGKKSRLIKYILSSRKCFAFDEFKFLHIIFSDLEKQSDFSWDKRISNNAIDLSYYVPYHYCSNRLKEITEYKIDGTKILAKFGYHREFEEVPYVHFQKRRFPQSVFSHKMITLPVKPSIIESKKFKLKVVIARLKAKIYVESFFKKLVLSKLFR